MDWLAALKKLSMIHLIVRFFKKKVFDKRNIIIAILAISADLYFATIMGGLFVMLLYISVRDFVEDHIIKSPYSKIFSLVAVSITVILYLRVSDNDLKTKVCAVSKISMIDLYRLLSCKDDGGSGSVPAHVISDCEKIEYFKKVKKDSIDALTAYIDQCEPYHTAYLIEAKQDRDGIEFEAIDKCIVDQKCSSSLCFGKKTHIPIEKINALKLQSNIQQEILKCGVIVQPPLLPPPLPCTRQDDLNEAVKYGASTIRDFIKDCELKGGSLLDEAIKQLNQLELRLYQDAIYCIKSQPLCESVGINKCISIYSNDFPTGDKLEEIRSKAHDRVDAPSCQPPPPRLDPVWQNLSDVLAEAEKAPSAVADSTVRKAYSEAEQSPSNMLSNEQRDLEDRAKSRISVLDESTKRLNKIIDEAKAWNNRNGPGYHNFSKIKRNITDYDRGRFNEDGYQDAWDTLVDAEKILKWVGAKITQENMSQIPIYLYDNNTGSIDDQVAHALRKELNQKFNIVDEIGKSVFFIQIEKAESIFLRNDDEQHQWNGRTKFMVKSIWIGGRLAFYKPISADYSSLNSDSKAGDGSFDKAIAEAVMKFPGWLTAIN